MQLPPVLLAAWPSSLLGCSRLADLLQSTANFAVIVDLVGDGVVGVVDVVGGCVLCCRGVP